MTQLNAATTALLIVHLQNDIVSEGTAFGSIFAAEASARNVVARTNAAAEALRAKGGLVVPLRIAFEPDFSNLNPTMPLLQMVEQAGCLKDGSSGAALVDDFVVVDGDAVVTHQRPGPFTDSNLSEVLDSRGITAVAVCGVATNASVEGAVRQAADLGYQVLVVSDAASAADAASHEAALGSMGLFAQAVTVDEFTARLA